MAKKSKKITPHQQQKILDAQLKKAFRERLRKMCEIIGDKSYFNVLPPLFIDILYTLRGYSLRVLPWKDSVVPKAFLKDLEAILRHWSNNTQLEVIEGSGKTVSGEDFIHVLQSFAKMFEFEVVPFEGMELFDPLVKNYKRIYHTYFNSLVRLAEAVIMLEMDLSAAQHTYHIHINVDEESLRGKFSIELEKVELDTVYVTFNGNSRLCTRVGLIRDTQLIYPDIPVSKFDPQSKFGKLNVPVYIQPHALKRIAERTGIPTPGLINFHIFQALMVPSISIKEDGGMLIEFYIENLKVGYLLADLTDGMIIIRTFLFLTNNGTPEGKKLEELTGLQKDDKKYWGIDNLQALTHSDILENDEICSIFRQAGCEPLLQLCEKMQKEEYLWKGIYAEENTNISHVSSAILDYLQKETPFHQTE
ncbi:MAG: hypothetical protein LBR81_02720 [Prevotellaceae bacterium]|jgi:hypothetical protein|nr:hypothetical protein [Prevotellaceae bacterium]